MLLWALSTAIWASVAAKRPHILYIVVDDMGWNDIEFTEGRSTAFKLNF